MDRIVYPARPTAVARTRCVLGSAQEASDSASGGSNEWHQLEVSLTRDVGDEAEKYKLKV